MGDILLSIDENDDDDVDKDGDDVIPRTSGESHREWMERTEILMKYGDLTQPDETIALSMMWRNMHLLGCNYDSKAKVLIENWDSPIVSKFCSKVEMKKKELNIKDSIAQ